MYIYIYIYIYIYVCMSILRIKNRRIYNDSDHSVKREKIETKNILIDKKNFKGLVIHFIDTLL